jgi:pimeloyl-ACP methyl ester carboxylesterase
MSALRLRSILGFALSAILSAQAQEPTTLDPIDHRRVMHYIDEQGRERPVANAEDWEKRRAAIKVGFGSVAGALPERGALAPVTVRIRVEEEREMHVLKTVDLGIGGGVMLPCLLYIPKGIEPGEKRAGIIALHPTHKIGKLVVDGRSERPNRAYARELADRGFVVIAPDYPSFGELAGYGFATDGFGSGTMAAIWNHLRCVDFLCAHAAVDGERIGAIGHSLGGHNAIFLALFDLRVKVVVSSCGWTPFHDYYGGNLKGWAGERYFPRLRKVYELDPDRVPFDFYELIAAIAPRAFFSNSPLGDTNFDYRGVEKAAPEARKVYSLLGVPEKLRIAYPDADHDFPSDVREEAYRFLDRHLAE